VFYSSTANLTNPNNLWYAVQAYCETTESSFVTQIPKFVQAAEQRIYNTVQIPAIRKNTTLTFGESNVYLTLPTDWLATFSLAVIDGDGKFSYLLDKDVNFIRESYPNPETTGVPQHYAIYSQSATTPVILVGPTPDSEYSAELNYYYYPESIVTAGTSWLGTNFETVLLYGTIREAYTYLKGEQDLMAAYEQKYQEALGLLKVLGDGKDRRDAYRDGQARVDVP
jgi:hypothetical protein